MLEEWFPRLDYFFETKEGKELEKAIASNNGLTAEIKAAPKKEDPTAYSDSIFQFLTALIVFTLSLIQFPFSDQTSELVRMTLEGVLKPEDVETFYYYIYDYANASSVWAKASHMWRIFHKLIKVNILRELLLNLEKKLTFGTWLEGAVNLVTFVDLWEAEEGKHYIRWVAEMKQPGEFYVLDGAARKVVKLHPEN